MKKATITTYTLPTKNDFEDVVISHSNASATITIMLVNRQNERITDEIEIVLDRDQIIDDLDKIFSEIAFNQIDD